VSMFYVIDLMPYSSTVVLKWVISPGENFGISVEIFKVGKILH